MKQRLSNFAGDFFNFYLPQLLRQLFLENIIDLFYNIHSSKPLHLSKSRKMLKK